MVHDPAGRLSNSVDADVLVVGSGFGGAVSALRLAERGYRVVVLEQGLRYRTEDFPTTNWSLRRYLWAPRLGLRGIQVLSFFRHVLVLHGRGVGGGSLVYANTLVQPEPEVLNAPEWGGEGWAQRLAPFYDVARRMLGASPCPEVGRLDEALASVARSRGLGPLRRHDVGVFFGMPGEEAPDPYFGGQGPPRTGCTRCGACMIGCGVGAKNTLDKNYLWLAERLGVRIVPDTEVLTVHETDGGYALVARKATGLRRPRRVWRARKVVVSAGVVGTLRLLHRSRAAGGLPRISGTLGRRVRTNSESILAAEAPRGSGRWVDHVAITSGVQVDPDTHVEMVRFNEGSDALFWLTAPLPLGSRRLPGLLRVLAGILRHPLRALRGLWPFGRAGRTGIVLAMQSTAGHLSMEFRRRWWRLGRRALVTRIPEGEAPPVPSIPVADDLTRALAREMRGVPLSTWPDVALGAPVTAHALGGCCLGRSAEDAVVDERGEVFGHPGLYVVDGSVIPVNLGVNPSLTITAVAEYMMSRMPSPEADFGGAASGSDSRSARSTA